MTNLSQLFTMFRLNRDEEGATATEYVVLLVFIALAIIVGATFLGGSLNTVFNDAGTQLTDETS